MLRAFAARDPKPQRWLPSPPCRGAARISRIQARVNTYLLKYVTLTRYLEVVVVTDDSSGENSREKLLRQNDHHPMKLVRIIRSTGEWVPRAERNYCTHEQSHTEIYRGVARCMEPAFALTGEPESEGSPISRQLWDDALQLAFLSLHNPFVRHLADGTLSRCVASTACHDVTLCQITCISYIVEILSEA